MIFKIRKNIILFITSFFISVCNSPIKAQEFYPPAEQERLEREIHQREQFILGVAFFLIASILSFIIYIFGLADTFKDSVNVSIFITFLIYVFLAILF